MIATIRRRIAKWIHPEAQINANDRRARRLVRNANCTAPALPAENETNGMPSLKEQWIHRTHEMAIHTVSGKDGRLRLRGQSSLDICASAAMLPTAVDAFAGWLVALEAAGIKPEIRSVDGWRVCAVMGGVPLAIRVRERLTRVTLLGGANLLLERLMGGGNHQSLEPSGRLDLQVMRYGVSALSIAFDPNNRQECYRKAVQGLLELHEREQRYQQKLRLRVHQGRSVQKAHTEMVSGTLRAGARRGVATPWTRAAEGMPKAADLLSLTPTETVLHLLQQMDSALLRLHPSVALTVDMSASLGNLGRVCRLPESDTPDRQANESRMPLQVLSGPASSLRGLHGPKRVVA